MSQEFKLIKKITETMSHNDQIIKGKKSMNRYSDMGAYSHTSISLRNEDLDDPYINANYINSAISKRMFIASQGPMPHTMDHFWSMVW